MTSQKTFVPILREAVSCHKIKTELVTPITRLVTEISLDYFLATQAMELDICLRVLLLLISYNDCVLVYATTSTSDFSKAAFAARSAGFSSLTDASRQFFASIAQNGTSAVSNCVSGGSGPSTASAIGVAMNDPCKYLSGVVFWFAFAFVLAILLFVISIGFCCGRWYCNCCCQPCASPACGGNKPTVTYTSGWVVFHGGVYTSVLVLVFVLTIVGFNCCLDTSTAVTAMGHETISAFNFTSNLLSRISPNVLRLSPMVNSIASSVSQRLNGIAVVESLSTAFVTSLVTSDAQVQKLQFFVEGCKSSVPLCNFQQNPAGWNKCSSGAHTTGSGAVLSTGKTNPACRDQSGKNKTCPCCTNCSIARGLLADTQLKVPKSWKALDKKISGAEFVGYLKKASNTAKEFVDPMDESVSKEKETVTTYVTMIEDSKGAQIAVSFLVWAPGWAIATFALLGICLASWSEPEPACASSLPHPSSIGHCLHWTAFTMAVIWVAFVWLPLFAVLSFVSLPVADVCRLIPRTGQDPSKFFGIFAGIDQNVTAAFRECVLAPGGSVINSSMADRLNAAFDPLKVIKSRIPTTTIAQYLSVEEQSAPFIRAEGVCIP